MKKSLYFFMGKKKIFEILRISFLVFLGVILRLLPHPPNFVPIAALALFGGAYLNKKYFWMVPLLAMWISDYFIGAYEPKLMIAVYGSFGIISLIGLFLRKRKNPGIVLSGSVISSFLFFLITNAAVWAFTPWYPKDFSGLLLSYTLAVPFLKNTILGDLFYTSLFFGVWEVYLKRDKLLYYLKPKFAAIK